MKSTFIIYTYRKKTNNNELSTLAEPKLQNQIFFVFVITDHAMMTTLN